MGHNGPQICSDLHRTLAHLGAARMVVGHTPQVSRRALIKCDGRFIVLDVGMSRWLFGERGSDRPEKDVHPASMDLEYKGASGEELLTSLRIRYHDEVADIPFSTSDHSEL